MSKLAVIAGRGELPLQLACQARQQGHEVMIFAIAEQADADFSDFPNVQVALGTIGETRRLVQQAGCTKLVMIGKVRRPSIAQLRPDAEAVKLLARAVGRGDDGLLRAVAAFFDEVGIETIAPDEVLRQQLMPADFTLGALPDSATADIACGIALLDALGNSDVGQGVVVQDQRIIAIEAAEGTDAMLARCATLLDPEGVPAVFVKRRKSGQDSRLDVPVLGRDTIEAASQAGISVIALESGGVLLADSPEKLWRLAEKQRVAIVGI